MTFQHPLAGVYAAAVTPLKDDSTLDLEAVPALMQFLASRGCHGAALFGTTGEGPSFSPAEREALIRVALAARESLGGFRLIAGTSTPSLSETIELTKLAFDLGCDAALVVPPYYFRKVTDDGLFNWFSEAIRKAVPADKFLIGYHIPPLTGVGFSIPLLTRLKEAFPVQFAGIKDSSHDPAYAEAVGKTFGSDLLALNGTDSYLKFAMEHHAAGCITAPANLISPDLREVWDLFRAGKDTSEAQHRVTSQRHLLEEYPPFPPLLKAALHRLHNLPRWAVKPPLDALSMELEEKVLQEMEALQTQLSLRSQSVNRESA
ncbi:MAG: dihydrodipicolinate synthase family protein [Anaerolineales bacterium]|nr:dihydrodipicolinate synthase family protein [Anaerolineales bacterium]